MPGVVDLRETDRPEDEERLLRQIGLAVAVQWRRMPQEVRAIILNQAEINSGSASTLRARMETFLEEYSTGKPSRTS
jgi:hypothetical protein